MSRTTKLFQLGFSRHDKISPQDDYSGLSMLERMRDIGRGADRFSTLDDVSPVANA
jgi:hypothetical protein